MSLLPRLCSGVSPIVHVAESQSAFFYHRWRKRCRSFQLTCFAAKHGRAAGATSIQNTSTKEQSGSLVLRESFIKFDELIASRREQARQSLVVQVQSESSCSELREYCEKISPINSMFHYKLKENHYVLLQFKENCLSEVLDTWCHVADKSTIPVASPVVWFKASPSGRKKIEVADLTPDPKVVHIPPQPSYDTVLSLTAQARSMSALMEILYDNTKLDELGTRLRFFTARQLELAMSGLFPHCAIYPFGSSVNGFGKAGSDLDLVFRHDASQSESGKMSPRKRSLRLVYQTKTSLGGPRPLTQRQMELLADLLQVMIPGCSGVKRILQARVPIVKYTNDFTGLDCDLSMSNMTGVYMSELLFLYSQLDPSSKLLICFVKHWAAATQLTNPSPGRWVTNFMLLMLCIHYLQSVKRLPPLDLMVKDASEEDERITDDINCTFVRDLRRLNWAPSTSTSSPSKLLRGFFEYYINFDFEATCISITTDSRLTKPDYSPLYIVNPLERSLNVAKNVSGEELEKLKMGLRNAAWTLESGDLPVNALLTRLGQNHNSLSPLIHTNHRRLAGPRMVTVKELFTDS